jgi:radical SAM superfamily enzyme YgiQ (UPF0313 family)
VPRQTSGLDAGRPGMFHVKHMRALLINPYIYDVSAYSFWSAPLGLLYVGSVLRQNGIDIQLIDCLAVDETKRKKDGRAPFIQTKVAKPEAAAAVKKRFRRYGIAPAFLQSKLRTLEPPDLILVTSAMTYWYLGALEAVVLAREIFPNAKIVVGGLYPSLCQEHAERHLSADLVVRIGAMSSLYTYIEDVLSKPLRFKPDMEDLKLLPYPCFDLYEKPFFVPLLTSLGCGYRCAYCATHYLHPHMVRRAPQEVLRELSHWYDRGCAHFALYDDSFLTEREAYAKPLLRAVSTLSTGISFHNPNALNASMIDEETALLLREAGFPEVRIGLETADAKLQAETGGKIDRHGFERAVGFLKRAGFEGTSICVYVLAGLPFQRGSDVRKTVDYVAGLGLRVSLADYSPIPHTPLFEAYHTAARYPVAEEPLFQNNALFPFAWEGFTEQELNELKAYVRERNALLGAGKDKGSG